MPKIIYLVSTIVANVSKHKLQKKLAGKASETVQVTKELGKYSDAL